jgi:hypothetical protein
MSDGRCYVRAMSDEDAIDVVLSAGDLDPHVVAVRELLHRVNAIEVQALVDRGEDRPAAHISCGRLQPVEVTDAGRTVHLPHTAELAGPPPAYPKVPPLPPIEVDAETGTVSAPLGAVQALVEAVGVLAAALGGRSVALALFQTTDDETPFGIAARTGERPVLTLGDQQYEIPAA